MKKHIDKAETNCGACRFGLDDAQPNVTICRFNPPIILMDLHGQRFTQWPLTGSLQVCGQFEPGARRKLLDEMTVTPTVAAEPSAH